MAQMIKAKVGEYTKDGQTKGIYRTVGELRQGDKGSFILLDAHFNPAGVMREQGRDRVILSVFEEEYGNKGGNTKDDLPF